MSDEWYSLNGDTFLSLLLAGVSRAEERRRERMNTVDEHGNVIQEGVRDVEGREE